MARSRTTSRSVHRADRFATATISVGGVVVLAAVLGICAYLAWVVAPLLQPGRVVGERAGAPAAAGVIAAWADDQSVLLASVDAAGVARASLLREGPAFEPVALAGEGSAAGLVVSALSVPSADGRLAIGYESGEVALARVGFATRVVAEPEAGWTEWGALRVVPGAGGAPSAVAERTPRGAWRVVGLAASARAPVKLGAGAGAVRLVDYAVSVAGKETLAALREDGTLVVNTVRVIRPLTGGEPTVRLQGRSASLADASDPPGWLAADADGAVVYTLWRDGRLARWAVGGGDGVPVIAEELRVTEPGVGIRLARMMQGGRTLVVADESGGVRTFASAPNPASATVDGLEVVRTGEWRPFERAGEVVSVVGVASRGRTIGLAGESGEIVALDVTSGKTVARARGAGPVSALAIHPRLDGVTAVGVDGSVRAWSIEPGYPGASVRALAMPIIYEGALEPAFVYQSSSASDTAELKTSLVPLVFGTLKATVVSMLIAAPLAVLAAVFTSEFMHRRVRSTVKPVVELMASLPSVVLGFFAMAVFAPLMSAWLGVVLLAFVTVPLAVVVGAHGWSMLPPRVTRATATLPRLGAVALVALAGLLVAVVVAPVVEGALFRPREADLWRVAGSVAPAPADAVPIWVGARGDAGRGEGSRGAAVFSPDELRRLHSSGLGVEGGAVVAAVEPTTDEARARVAALRADPPASVAGLRAWLDGGVGDPSAGWVLVLGVLVTPAALALRGVTGRAVTDGLLSGRSAAWAGAVELAVFIGWWVALALGVAVLSGVLGRAGLDARDTILGAYSERNTLVVGIVMGFAIIPLIYTISEDALSSVPASLRSASLGCGATPWQTARRVVLPVAGSGIFSACMIGFGRAVGETMIMLMATGNTPDMDLNIFAGFRTLAANIATELPEAERNGTHYRVLFLCGLVLFVMTLVINTTAEVVRQRFRRRSAAL